MKGKKKILLAVVLVLVIAVGVTSGVVISKKNKTVVKVFPVSMLNSSDWFDTDTSLTGTLTSDYIQEVHIDSGQKVKKVYVKKGDKVKKGDILLKYNVSEKELDLKLQKLQIQSSKLEIEQMEKELQKLKNTKTVGSINTGNSSIMNASVNLSGIKNKSLSYLVAEADSAEEGTTIATGGEGKTGSDTGSENGSGSESGSGSGSGTGTESGSGSGSGTGTESGSGSGSGTGTESGSGSGNGTGTESGSGSGSGTGTESGSGSGSGTGTESGSESGSESGKDDKNPEPKENINSLEDASGKGTKDDKYIFDLKKGGKVSGSVIKQLKDKGENGYAVFREHDGDDTSTYTLTPEKLSNINVKESKMYSVEELKNGGDEDIVDNVSSDESYIKGSGTKEDPYVYNLNINGSILGDVIQKLIKDGKYAKFVEYESEQQTGKTYVLTPDTAFRRDIVSEENYTIASLNELTKASYTDLPKAITSIDDKDDYDSSDEKYVYYLSDNGVIKGSVIKELIKSKKSAEFISYASEKDYKAGTKQFTLSVNADTKFKNILLDSTQYAISDLIDNIQKDEPTKPTTEQKDPTKPVTKTKTIKFKQNRKKITAGNGCLLTVVTSDGKSIDQTKVKWELLDNISKDTTITKTKSGIWLYVDEGEPSSSVTITAQVKNVKGISTEKISRTIIIKGADTGGDDGGNGGGSGTGGSGSEIPGDSSGGDDGENDYTAAELRQAISDKEDEISQAKEDLHEAQINYNEAKAEVDKATVKAKLAGTVTTACSKGTLPTDGSAAIVIKAADGMYVKTSVSEMELESVKVGGTIKCVSSDTGDEYTAEIKEISDFPTADSSNDGGTTNPNSSYYPIVAFIKDADGLSPGGSVEVSYSSKSMGTASKDAVYIQKAYIRTEDKKSYVYIRDKKTKRLKKQYITVGKTMNGQYMEIVSGLTENDNIAFPYGKNLREGVKTKISEDDSEMIY